MRLIKILAGILVLLIIGVGGLVFYAERLDWNTVRPRVEKEIAEATGREFEISGNLDFTLFPKPTVSAEGLRLTNADWGSAPLMLEADSVIFTLTLRSIVLGNPHARAITLRGVKLLLEEHPDGRDNWHFDGGAAGAAAGEQIFPKLRSLDAADVSVVYKRPGQEPLRVAFNTADIGAPTVGRGLRLDARGQLNGRDFTIGGKMAPLAGFLRGGHLEGQIDVESGDLQLSLDGDFGRLTSLAGVDMALSGQGDSVPAIGALAELPEDMRGKWAANLRLAGDGHGYRISDADVELGDSSFKGNLAHDVATGYSGTLDIDAPTYELHLDGSFGSLKGLEGVDAKVEGQGTAMPPIPALASLPAHLRRDWKADFRVREMDESLALSDMKLRFGGSDLAGTVSIDRSGSRPRVEGKLKSDFVDIAFLRRGDVPRVVQQERSGTADGQVLNDEPIPLEWMKAVDASVEIDAKRLQATLFTYTDTLTRIELENGFLRVKAERGTIYGADTSAELQFDASTQPAKLSINVLARGADVGRIMGDWSEPPFMAGQGDFDIQLTATGNSAAALMGSVSGQARVVVGEGTAQVGVLEQMVRTVGIKTLGVLLGEDKADVVPMNCFAANLTADAGVVKAEVLVLDTDKATVFGSGSFDLRKETWDLIFKPKPKQVTLTTAVPIHLGGTFRDPEVSAEKVGTLRKLAGIASLFVFPPAAVAGLVDFGAGDNQCVDLAAEGSKK
ncbi:MAG: AsmA family protein [Gammaproteobacteria bacterium]|jgi:hypothetical protein